MLLARVVIERIPTDRQKAAMPNATLDERVESQRPVSAWVDLPEAMDLYAYLRTFYPVLVDDDGAILTYAVQNCEWPDDSIPPPPMEFDLAAVGRAHASYKLAIMPIGPAFGVEDWEVIREGLNLVKGENERRAKSLIRSAQGHIENLKAREGRMEKMKGAKT